MSDGIGGGGGSVGGPQGVFEALKSGQIQGDRARLKAAASLLESSFYQELFKAMRDTVPDSGLLSGGSGEDMFTSLMDQQLADQAAARAERGLSKALYRQLAPALGIAEEAVADSVPLLDGDGPDPGAKEGDS